MTKPSSLIDSSAILAEANQIRSDPTSKDEGHDSGIFSFLSTPPPRVGLCVVCEQPIADARSSRPSGKRQPVHLKFPAIRVRNRYAKRKGFSRAARRLSPPKWPSVPTTSELYLQLRQQVQPSKSNRDNAQIPERTCPEPSLLKDSDSPPTLLMRSPPELSPPATTSSSGLGVGDLTSMEVDESSRPMSLVSPPGMVSPEVATGYGGYEECLDGPVPPVHRAPK
jgi:hypothetical protein